MKRKGINLSYAIQPSPDGLAQTFLISEKSIKWPIFSSPSLSNKDAQALAFKEAEAFT